MGILELKKVKNFLDFEGIPYNVSEHEPVYTSKQAANIRGVEMKTGVKALVLKTTEGKFIMGLIAADKRIDLKKVAEIVHTKKIKLASPQEVLATTGCEIGSVHPFGPLYALPTFMDSSVLENERVNFNAGMHTVSIEMNKKDLIKAIKPVINSFAKKSAVV